MHDGYLYTLGICGTVAASTPAPALLNTMLAALPPVKRAALLGEVLPLDTNGDLHDPLVDAIVADMHDAEVVLLVSPLYYRDGQVALPARLTALLDRAMPLVAAGQLRDKVAALVGVIPAPPENVGCREVLAPLHHFCARAGITVAGVAVIDEQTDSIPRPETLQTVRELARCAYAQARRRCPAVLPHTVS